MACSPLSCWLHSLKPVRCRLPTQVATSRFPRTSAGSPYGLPRQSKLASYFPVGKLGSLDSHRAFPSTPARGGSAALLFWLAILVVAERRSDALVFSDERCNAHGPHDSRGYKGRDHI